MNKFGWALLIGVVFLAAELAATAEPAASAPAPGTATEPAKALTLDLGNKVDLKLVLIPAGKFVMGSPKTDKDFARNEGPQHEVTLTKAFYIGIYHVTQEQYEAVIGRNPSFIKGPQNPVEQISWDEAVTFCKKASEKTGKEIHLPTEAQWEYACRAGSTTRYSFGDDEKDLGDYAWYWRNSEKGAHPVGLKKPNAWGLYDMHGNVGAWCSDLYATNAYVNADKTDPQGPTTGNEHVLRGGCWGHDANFCRSAFRLGGLRGGSLYGFRVIVDAK